MASSNTSTDASLKELSEKSVEDKSSTEDSNDQEEKLSPTKTWLLVSSLCVCVLRRIDENTTNSF